MRVVCTTCGRDNTDPGGDLSEYRCGACGSPTLVRVTPPPVNRNSDALAGLVIGGALGAALGGPIGAVLGGVVGAILTGTKSEAPKNP